MLLCACQLHAQPSPQTQRLSTADGLSDDGVSDILQSRDGFIWIATNNGLNRYDGARFKVFLPESFNQFSISGHYIYGLFEDSRGWIWIHLVNGIDVLDPKSGRFFHVLRREKSGGHQAYDKRNFFETPDGAVWFFGINDILKFDLQMDMLEKAFEQDEAYIEPLCKKVIAMPSADGQLSINCVFFSQHQKFLLGTYGGVWTLDPYNQKLELIGMPMASISWIGQDPAGRIWMHHRGRKLGHIPLFESPLMPETETTVWDEKAGIAQGRTIKNHLEDVTFDTKGSFWGWQGDTLKQIQTQRFLNHENAEIEWPLDRFFSSAKQLSSILLDRSGVLWLGSYTDGISKVNLQPPIFKSYLPNTDQGAIFETPGGKFLTLEGSSLKYHTSIRFDQSEPNPYYVANIPVIVPSIFDFGAHDELMVKFDPDGNGWIRNNDCTSVFRRDAQTGELTRFSSGCYELCFDAKGRLITLSDRGLLVLDPKTGQSQSFDYKPDLKITLRGSDRLYNGLWKGFDGVMWIFSRQGLIKAVPSDAGYEFEYFTHNPKDRSSLSSDVVYSVADDPIEPDRYLWVATGDGGLDCLDKQSGEFKHYTKEQGLPSNSIFGVLAENKGPYIWLSTDKGLSRFDVRAKVAMTFTVVDGLPTNQFRHRSYLKTRDGALIFGGISGLTAFYPDSLRFNRHAPQTQIVGLRVNNQVFDLAGKSHISLSHEQNMLSFDFAALEFTNPAQNQYRYQLVGADEDWVSLGTQNSIQFAGLSPGTYTFKVMGSNNHGIWSEQAAELHFTIRPPW